MRRLLQYTSLKTVLTLLMMLTFLLCPSAFSGEKKTYSGVITVSEDDENSIIFAEIEITSLNGLEYYPIILNDKTRNLVMKFADDPVEVTGSITIKDEEEWLSIDSCFHALIGTLQVTEDEEDEIAVIKILTDDWGSFDLPLNDRSIKCAETMLGKLVRIVGLIDSTKKTFDLRDYCEFICGRGYFETDENEDGDITSILFVLLDDEDEILHRYNIPLDECCVELAEQYEEEEIVVTGTVENKKDKTWLCLHTCGPCSSEDEEEEEWDEWEEDDDEEGDE